MQNPTTGLTDISNLPADRVKPQEGKIEQSASQSSTMQSVSMNEVNNENIREQMPQGSLEHLNAEPSIITQGVEAVKEFAHKAVEKIEEFVNATAEKIHDLSKDFNTELSKDTKLVGESLKDERALWKSEGKAAMSELSKDAHELKEGAIKRAYLVRRTVSRRLGKKGEKAQKQAGLVSGIAKVYAKEELKSLRRKANRYGRNFNKDASLAKRSLKEEGKSLEGKAQRFQADFSRDGSMIGAQLREGARNLRSQARRLLNDLPRQAESAKESLIKQAGDIKSELQSKPAQKFSFADDASSKNFLLEFSSNEMNGKSGKFRSQSAKPSGFEGDFQGKPSQWSMEVSAHDWNESVSTARKHAGFLMDKAQDFLKRASRQAHYAQRRFEKESRSLKRSAEGLLEKGKQSL